MNNSQYSFPGFTSGSSVASNGQTAQQAMDTSSALPIADTVFSNNTQALCLKNAISSPVSAIPVVPFAEAEDWVIKATTEHGCRLVALFPLPPLHTPPLLPQVPQVPVTIPAESTSLCIVVAHDPSSSFFVMATPVGASYKALTGHLPQAHLFERLLYEEHGILPQGHPWLKPVRFSSPQGPDVGDTEFYSITGQDVHEVAVGPIHAGVIECGHFRFQCLGEVVMHLEISLGYHHRGIRPMLAGLPSARTLALMELIAGDTTIAHTWAYCSLIESLTKVQPSPHSQYIRALALELERMANHTGDLGALAGDTGFLPTQSYCGRLRGDWLNITALLCGNRFGRSLVVPGGVGFSMDAELIDTIRQRINATEKDVHGAVGLLWKSSSFLSRIEAIGTVAVEDGLSIGLKGPAARACGLARDARHSHPLPHLEDWDAIQTRTQGDVHARTKIRQKEIKASAAYCRKLLDLIASTLPEPEAKPDPALAPQSIAIATVEGWRGEVCHVVVTDEKSCLAAYEIMDPSMHNWLGLALALRNQQISDFPLCNKSFNLSYCGHDL